MKRLRYWLLLSFVLLGVLVAIALKATTVSDSVGMPDTPTAELTGDRLRHPPVRQSYENGAFRLTIEAIDGWETPSAIAQLYEGNVLRWQQSLPHEYGPRFAVVGRQGQVLLLDEYINVASEYAIALYSPKGEQIAQYSFDDISQTLDIPAAQLTRWATSGWWISAAPSSTAVTDQVTVQTGGTALIIDLSTGTLTAGPPSEASL